MNQDQRELYVLIVDVLRSPTIAYSVGASLKMVTGGARVDSSQRRKLGALAMSEQNTSLADSRFDAARNWRTT